MRGPCCAGHSLATPSRKCCCPMQQRVGLGSGALPGAACSPCGPLRSESRWGLAPAACAGPAALPLLADRLCRTAPPSAQQAVRTRAADIPGDFSIPAAPILVPEGPWREVEGSVCAPKGFKAQGGCSEGRRGGGRQGHGGSNGGKGGMKSGRRRPETPLPASSRRALPCRRASLLPVNQSSP